MVKAELALESEQRAALTRERGLERKVHETEREREVMMIAIKTKASESASIRPDASKSVAGQLEDALATIDANQAQFTELRATIGACPCVGVLRCTRGALCGVRVAGVPVGATGSSTAPLYPRLTLPAQPTFPSSAEGLESRIDAQRDEVAEEQAANARLSSEINRLRGELAHSETRVEAVTSAVEDESQGMREAAQATINGLQRIVEEQVFCVTACVVARLRASVCDSVRGCEVTCECV